jgi:UAA transporter family
MNIDNRPKVLTAGGASSLNRPKPSGSTEKAHKPSNMPPTHQVENPPDERDLLNLEYEAEENGPSQSPSPSRSMGFSDRVQSSSLSIQKPVRLVSHPLPEPEPSSTSSYSKQTEIIWLTICFLGIMASFVCYGLLLEYTTSGGRKLHELSFLFVTSALYTLTAAAGSYVRDETPTTIPPARFAILGLTSMGSTFCSVRSLRYVIYPIQVLAKSCKPVPVMLMGAVMGKKCKYKTTMTMTCVVHTMYMMVVQLCTRALCNMTWDETHSLTCACPYSSRT